jgi:hypothetical protein
VNRYVRGGVLLVPTVLVVLVCLFVALAARDLTERSCQGDSARWVDAVIVLACVGAFVLGRVLVERRERGPRGHGRRGLDPPGNVARRRWGSLIAHGALAFVFLCGVGALAYETVGVWTGTPWGFEPITHYVRCAKASNPAVTGLVAATVSFFVGHWLWFPNRSRR